MFNYGSNGGTTRGSVEADGTFTTSPPKKTFLHPQFAPPKQFKCDKSLTKLDDFSIEIDKFSAPLQLRATLTDFVSWSQCIFHALEGLKLYKDICLCRSF